MPRWTIYHNPRCSKSRQTLKLLQDAGVEPDVVEYLKNPPSVEELTQIISFLGVSASQLLRKKEAIYKDIDLDSAEEAEVIAAMVQHPVLIERPIVLKDDLAVLGRPPENVRKLL